MNKKDQLAWAKTELKSIMDVSNKTRYKEIASTPDNLKSLEESLLFVANAKAQAYKKAVSGNYPKSFNWVNENPDLAKNVLLLQQNVISISEIAMLPD